MVPGKMDIKTLIHAAEISGKLGQLVPEQVPLQRRRPRVSVLSAVWNLTNTVMGIGMLSLAGTMAQAGVVASTSFIFVFAAITIVSVMLLVDGAIDTQAKSYEELARITAGAAGERYVQVALLGSIASACVGFLVSVKDLAGFAASALSGMADDSKHSDELLLMLVAAVVVPMSLLRSLDAMQVTSFLSVLCLVWFVGVSSLAAPFAIGNEWACAKLPEQIIDRSPMIMPQTLNGLLTALSIIMSSFVCQTSVFPIWTEMREGDASHGLPVHSTRRRFKTAVLVTVGLCTAFYLAAGLSGYLSWASAVLSVDLVVQCYDPQSWYVLFTYVGLIMMCLFTFPLFLFVARSMVLRMAGYDERAPYHIFVGVGLALIVASVIPAMLVSDLGYVLAIGAAWVGPALTLEMPAICSMRNAETLPQKLRCGALLVVGVVVHVLAVLECNY